MLPNSLEICTRCERGIVVYLGMGDAKLYHASPGREKPWCYVCGNRQTGRKFVATEVCQCVTCADAQTYDYMQPMFAK